MPEGTRVARCVEELKERGGVESPYAVCQSATGQSYATGKPIKSVDDEPEDENVKTKAADDQLPDAAPAPAADDGFKDLPWGAQILHRKYADHAALLKDHEDMLGPLEHPEVRKHLEDDQAWHADRMDAIEKLYAKHYKDLPPLSAGDEDESGLDEHETKDASTAEDLLPDHETAPPDEELKDMDTLDDAGVPADSVDDRLEEGEHEPTPEEALEGMEQKDGGELEDDEDEFAEHKHLTNGHAKKRLRGSHRKAVDDETETEVEAKGIGDPIRDDDDLADHEKSAVSEASGFLKAVAEPESEWGEEQRFNSFHYHKTLKAIGDVGDSGSLGQDAGAVPGEEAKTLAVCMNCRGSGYGPDGEPCHECDGTGKVDKALRGIPDAKPDVGVPEAKDYNDLDLHDESKDLGSFPAAKPDVGLPEAKPEVSSIPAVKDFAAEEAAEGHTAPVGSPEWEAEEAAEAEHQKSHKRTTIKAASRFFKELSQTRDFGDGHRERSKAAAAALDDLVNARGTGVDDKAADTTADESAAATYEPGEMGEKADDDIDKDEKRLRKLLDDEPDADEDGKVKALDEDEEPEESAVQKVLKRKRLKQKAADTDKDDIPEPDAKLLRKSAEDNARSLKALRAVLGQLTASWN